MKLSINGQQQTVPDHLGGQSLLHTLREHFGLVGAKGSCGIGLCGSCTVHINGQPQRSCVLRTAETEGAAIVTIEGLTGRGGELHPVQQAWIDERVPQCGFCQAGQIMQAVALLAENAQPSEEDIRTAMGDHLCRCGTYDRIKKAIQRAASLLGSSAGMPDEEDEARG